MARVLPPPSERFDPITARWVTPGGPLHDPERDSFDPAHGEPVTLVGPIPRELAEQEAGLSDGNRAGRLWRRRRWMLLAVVGFGIIAMLVGGYLII